MDKDKDMQPKFARIIAYDKVTGTITVDRPVDFKEGDVITRRGDCVWAEGYRAMAEENLEFARLALPLALESWPEWSLTDTLEYTEYTTINADPLQKPPGYCRCGNPLDWASNSAYCSVCMAKEIRKWYARPNIGVDVDKFYPDDEED